MPEDGRIVAHGKCRPIRRGPDAVQVMSSSRTHGAPRIPIKSDNRPGGPDRKQFGACRARDPPEDARGCGRRARPGGSIKVPDRALVSYDEDIARRPTPSAK